MSRQRKTARTGAHGPSPLSLAVRWWWMSGNDKLGVLPVHGIDESGFDDVVSGVGGSGSGRRPVAGGPWFDVEAG